MRRNCVRLESGERSAKASALLSTLVTVTRVDASSPQYELRAHAVDLPNADSTRRIGNVKLVVNTQLPNTLRAGFVLGKGNAVRLDRLAEVTQTKSDHWTEFKAHEEYCNRLMTPAQAQGLLRLLEVYDIHPNKISIVFDKACQIVDAHPAALEHHLDHRDDDDRRSPSLSDDDLVIDHTLLDGQNDTCQNPTYSFRPQRAALTLATPSPPAAFNAEMADELRTFLDSPKTADKPKLSTPARQLPDNWSTIFNDLANAKSAQEKEPCTNLSSCRPIPLATDQLTEAEKPKRGVRRQMRRKIVRHPTGWNFTPPSP